MESVLCDDIWPTPVTEPAYTQIAIQVGEFYGGVNVEYLSRVVKIFPLLLRKEQVHCLHRDRNHLAKFLDFFDGYKKLRDN